jgi:outer membrane protein assembly factor BamA
MLQWVAVAVAVAVASSTTAPAASAQETRAELIERQRADKATHLQTYEPGKLEKTLLYLDAQDPMARLSPHDGFFVRYGYHRRPVGAGLGFGGGYRHDLFGRRARLVAEGGITFRRYELLRADFSLPYLAGERVEVGVETNYRRHPQEDFYGSGVDAIKDDRVNYLYKDHDVQARAIVKPQPWLAFGLHVGYTSPSIGSGTDSRFPSLETRFGDVDAPGLIAQPDFRYTDLFATVDYRDQPGNAKAGGYYSLTWAGFSDLDFDRYDFRRTDLHLQQFFPIFDKKRVFAVQTRVVTTRTAGGQQVPFYFQPTIGGSTSVRSLDDYRFRDRNALYLNVEYRWEVFSPLDMALFTDWGKVAPNGGDLDFGGLKHGYGIGFRFNSYKTVFFRFDVAAGAGEGVHYDVKFSKAF